MDWTQRFHDFDRWKDLITVTFLDVGESFVWVKGTLRQETVLLHQSEITL